MTTEFQNSLDVDNEFAPTTVAVEGTSGFLGTITHQWAIRKGWTLLRYEQAKGFACSLCKQQKMATLVAVKSVLSDDISVKSCQACFDRWSKALDRDIESQAGVVE